MTACFQSVPQEISACPAWLYNPTRLLPHHVQWTQSFVIVHDGGHDGDDVASRTCHARVDAASGQVAVPLDDGSRRSDGKAGI
jgi:hypothetical protein